jgi:hypothetical protein
MGFYLFVMTDQCMVVLCVFLRILIDLWYFLVCLASG